MMKGIVKEYDKTKGFGFISGEDGEDYFVHVYGLGPKLKDFGLRVGQKVVFDIDFDMKGDKAINVRPL
ncbi:MAG: cold-shock protein [Candidatus Marinimicrobia bacterium]|nr:cold-shock protein [Candidatus Neomarinimicrobiota bacterium]MBT5096885.1 cold-shock protein [Candidatus Neomarinimicrobiota bacterium]